MEERPAPFDAPGSQPQQLAVPPHQGLERARAASKALARTCAPETHDLPTYEARAAREPYFRANVGEGTVVHDRFLRQPLEAGAVRDLQVEALTRPRTGRAVPPGGARCGEQRMRALGRARPDLELVAARDARRRVDHDGGADPRSPRGKQR